MIKTIVQDRFCIKCKGLIKRNCVPALYKNREYCSKECWYHREEQLSKKCLFCKETFLKPRRMPISRWNNQRYCCHTCQGKHLDQSHLTPFQKGENHLYWRGGTSKERLQISNTKEYKSWRKSVFERDDYTCQFCKIRGGKLQVDHIKPFSLFPELRIDMNNGRTLCEECHEKTDTYGLNFHKLGITKENYEERMKQLKSKVYDMSSL